MCCVLFLSSDSTLSVENVSLVMSLVPPEHRMSIWEDIIPDFRYEAITREYHDGESQNTALVHFYVHCSGHPSWKKLAQKLYGCYGTPLPALEKIRQFLHPIGVFLNCDELYCH